MSKSLPLRAHEAAAYAAGRLTQLRRVCRPQPAFGCLYVMNAAGNGAIHISDVCSDFFVPTTGKTLPGKPHVLASPYGAPGDRLALREMFSYYERGLFKTPNGIWYWADGEVPGSDWSIPKSSTQMPLWAVRWHPVITAVRLERVQDMTEADAIRCGMFGLRESKLLPRDQLRPQFDRDNPRTPWDSNPWTWVIDVEGAKK